MGKIGIIIEREYTSRVKKKSFILTTLLVPIFIAALIAIPGLITYYSSDNSVRNIAVIDDSNIVANKLESSKTLIYTTVDREEGEKIKKDIENSKFYGVLEIGVLDSLMNASMAIYANEQVNIHLIDKIEGEVNDILRINKLQNYDIPDLEGVISNVQKGSSLKTYQQSKDEQAETSVISYMAVGYISSFFIYMFIFMFGSLVMRGVIEEKSNRIVEVIISSVKPTQLMIGKIVGVALVALTQFIIWIVVIGLILGGLSMAFKGSATEQIAQSAQMGAATNMGGVVNMQDITSIDAIDSSVTNVESGETSPISTIISTLKSMNILGVIGTFLIFFVFGYLLYSSMFAAVGASVDNEADTQQLMFPVTLPLIIGLFIMLNAFQNPNSAAAVWGSIIPFTSPMVMVARFAYGVPTWQYILSVTLLILTFFFMAWVSAKIYRIGILSYGKKASWKDIFKWIKFKD